jgi:hypothetical protein
MDTEEKIYMYIINKMYNVSITKASEFKPMRFKVEEGKLNDLLVCIENAINELQKTKKSSKTKMKKHKEMPDEGSVIKQKEVDKPLAPLERASEEKIAKENARDMERASATTSEHTKFQSEIQWILSYNLPNEGKWYVINDKNKWRIRNRKINKSFMFNDERLAREIAKYLNNEIERTKRS